MYRVTQTRTGYANHKSRIQFYLSFTVNLKEMLLE